ncbi:MAG: hypothetical protein AVDCRST_MAG53-519, partial [uncultured Solirubrobacteraceae bacterium]
GRPEARGLDRRGERSAERPLRGVQRRPRRPVGAAGPV